MKRESAEGGWEWLPGTYRVRALDEEARGPATAAAAGTTTCGGRGEDEGGRTARAAEGRGQAAGGGRVAARRLALERGERGARCEVRGVSTEGSARDVWRRTENAIGLEDTMNVWGRGESSAPTCVKLPRGLAAVDWYAAVTSCELLAATHAAADLRHVSQGCEAGIGRTRGGAGEGGG